MASPTRANPFEDHLAITDFMFSAPATSLPSHPVFVDRNARSFSVESTSLKRIRPYATLDEPVHSAQRRDNTRKNDGRRWRVVGGRSLEKNKGTNIFNAHSHYSGLVAKRINLVTSWTKKLSGKTRFLDEFF